MGNNSSKPKKSKSNGGSQPAFARTDTTGSTKSARSFRSLKSVQSEADSFKSAFSAPASPLPQEQALLSRPPSSTAHLPAAEDITPGPSILAIPGEPGASSEEPTTPIRPYHRRTYSSNSIINGGVVYEEERNEEAVGNGDSGGADGNDPSTASTSNRDAPGMSIVNTTLSAPHSTSNSPLGSPIPPSLNGSNGSVPTGSFAGSLPGSSAGKLGLRKASFASSTGGNSGITLNIDEVIQRLLDAGYRGRTSKHVCLKNNEIALICQTAREIFLAQPIVLDLSPPVKVVGDVHGQYGDLIRMFDMCGFPPSSNFLFLGDYVDRGKQSLETILLLLCYKIKYPENFFLLRGNHECANVTRVYGFYDECKRRCNIKTWKIFIDTFNTLPIAAIVAQKIFCVHGGLSPSLTNMNELRSIQRPTDVPDYGLLNDILWSDPADTENEWEDNERGVSYCFNKVAINKFLSKFGFDLVCRAHIVVEDGYEFFNDRTLVTVFSAPNYCGEFDNWGAVMSVSDDLLCSFELLKPLDSMALRQEMQRSRKEKVGGVLGANAQSV